MTDEPANKKIKRSRPNKKWSIEEINSLLDYLQEGGEFEAPAAQLFYKKSINLTGIDVSWDLLKWKVRHLRTNYNKACSWRNGTGVGLLENNGAKTFQDQLHKMCPYFERLEEIFAPKTPQTQVIVDTNSGLTPPRSECQDTEMEFENIEYLLEPNYETPPMSTNVTPTSFCNVSATIPTTAPKTSVEDPALQFAKKMYNSVPKKFSTSASQL